MKTSKRSNHQIGFLKGILLWEPAFLSGITTRPKPCALCLAPPWSGISSNTALIVLSSDATAHSVIRVKQAYPDVELLLLLPYHPAERPVELPQGFDGSYYPEGMERVPRRLAIVRANEYVIRHVCDHLIAYDRHLATKTHNFVELALQREKKGLMHVTNLAELKNT